MSETKENCAIYVDYSEQMAPLDPLITPIILTALCILLLVIGIGGNLCTCIVIKRNKTLQTTANYYVFNLAISDLIFGSIFPASHILYLWQTPTNCFKYGYIINNLCSLVVFITITNSILTLTVFSIERYIAICFPFLAHKLSSKRRATKFIVFIWVFSIGFNVARMFSYSLALELISFVTSYIIALGIITVLHSLMVCNISKGNEMSSISDSSIDQENMKVAKILSAITAVFFICWSPYQILFLLTQIYDINAVMENHKVFSFIIVQVAVFLAIISTCVNPILYVIMPSKLRQALKDTFFN